MSASVSVCDRMSVSVSVCFVTICGTMCWRCDWVWLRGRFWLQSQSQLVWSTQTTTDRYFFVYLGNECKYFISFSPAHCVCECVCNLSAKIESLEQTKINFTQLGFARHAALTGQHSLFTTHYYSQLSIFE